MQILIFSSPRFTSIYILYITNFTKTESDSCIDSHTHGSRTTSSKT